MELKIKLNNLKYRYDVYQMFNIYYALDEIKFEEDGNYIINIEEDKISFSFNDFYRECNVLENIKEDIKRLIFSSLKEITGDYYPWGILVGIRPSKIALKYLEEGKSEKEIIDLFAKKHLASEEKAKLCIKVAKKEQELVNKDEKSIAIYIGMAFCPTRCFYCSFTANPIGSNKKLVNPYLEALTYEIREMKKYVNERNLKIESVYFGGGTPTAVNNEEFEDIMKEIYNAFVLDKEILEFTVECGRPDSITLEKLQTMRKYNTTRISINPQTMNDETLKMIGRGHTSKDVIDKFNLARNLGFDDINMDMIIGLPGEGIKEAEYTANEILKLRPDSLTVHGLSLKRASILYENFILKKGIQIKKQDELSLMYEVSRNLAKSLNIEPYYMYRQKNMVGNMENLGYSKEGKECLYNIQMIEDKQTIIALGADAVSKVVFLEENRIERFGNVKDIREYTSRIKEMVEEKIKLLDELYLK
ncbi:MULTISPECIES: coproporphyrinogen III oxidase [Clostridium]|jgi:coproporphyrinogen dehydrogenase HemZ|uniref:coproporphyrinogen III oxidase n=1 Tax=Clostridium TaxID=1485 RepID=UPI00019AFE56|nr:MULTISPECIES: coproporphyrinogen III oxidase [Clostridium]EEH97514.1 coproporphyrinogen dehydrogenase HemZ [Clostridium sp. 7_2_43FAA]MBU6135013.1 coproporphyrinogen III oxidase [Clostridium tertium]MDB1933389.1 coproporphyrinogen III oxidase [Clostridium tertium]MDB1937463.1 coproporphyrinogen III oxidase [Clostridium tertium]MDB1940984.1 coproporphyrinogen III oxidase [Clostridium tertium]